MPRATEHADLLEARRFTEAYYTDKALRFGATPLGVDWTCVATQQMRFVQLLRVCDGASSFSINDVGCGYGALLDFLKLDHCSGAVEYRGVDLSAEMVRLARLRHPAHAAAFTCEAGPPVAADYSVASGIFNVRSSQSLPVWESAIEATLRTLAHASREGFAVNFLLPAPGSGAQSRARLYTTAPQRWMAYCTFHLDSDVELVAGYGLLEFTLLVRPRRQSPASKAWASASSGR